MRMVTAAAVIQAHASSKHGLRQKDKLHLLAQDAGCGHIHAILRDRCIVYRTDCSRVSDFEAFSVIQLGQTSVAYSRAWQVRYQYVQLQSCSYRELAARLCCLNSHKFGPD